MIRPGDIDADLDGVSDLVERAEPTPRTAAGRATRPNRGGSLPLVVVAVAPALAIIGLIGVVLWISLRVSVSSPGLTTEHYRTIFSDPFAYRALLNTAIFSVVATLTALAVGIPVAWLVERTDLKGKSILYTLMTVGIFIPGFFHAMGWILFLHPRIGVLNRWLVGTAGFDQAPLNIATLGGMGFVQGFGLAGLVFVFLTASFRAMDGSLEESAAVNGARPFTVLRRVTLPLAWPGLLAAVLFVLTINLSAFDVPLLIGLPNRIYTFSTFLLTMTTQTNEGVPPYGVVAAFGSLMIVFALLLSWWYSRMTAQARKYAVVTGRGFQRKLVPLGKWQLGAWLLLGGYFALSLLMPLILLTWTALLPYFQPFSRSALHLLSLDNFRGLPWPLVRRGLLNSGLLMLVTPALTFTVSISISWLVLRTRSRFRALLDFVAFLPVAVPAVVFGFAALLTVLNVPLPFLTNLYGSVFLLVIMYALVSLGFGTRTTNTALIQIHNELEDAARISGASQFATLRRIIVPLVLPAMLYGSLWIALLVFRDLTLPNILFSGDNMTVSMVSWSLWTSGELGRSSALNLIITLCLAPLVFIYLRYAGGVRIGSDLKRR